MESISKIQHLLAESKFVEAQKAAELILFQSKGSETKELLELYFESLKSQSRPLPSEQLFLLIDKLLPLQIDEAQNWLAHIAKEKNQQRCILIEIKIAEMKGKTAELYSLISQFQIMRFEAHTPKIPSVIQDLSKKYFPQDFHLQLQKLALELMLMDLAACEASIKRLILSCFEKNSPRGTQLKLNLLYEVLKSSPNLKNLEIYKNLCYFIVNDVIEKKDYKKIIELIIYFDDFKFQVLILDILSRENLKEVATDYAQEIRLNEAYNYVYLDKFFPHLKLYFLKPFAVMPSTVVPKTYELDLKVEKLIPFPFVDEILTDVSEEEILLTHLLKHQSFSTIELLEIAVSFMQSEYYVAALEASEMACASTVMELKLRACYLKVTCMLKMGDWRAALDVSLNALSLSTTQNDILSFLYSQAEAHLRLKEYNKAKNVLEKISRMDESYRLVREKLEMLNAI